MKLEILASDLQGAMNTVGVAVASSTTLPVLKMVKLAIDARDKFFLETNNLETGLKLALDEVNVIEAVGDGVCVPYQPFNGWLQAMEGAAKVLLTVDYETMALDVVCGQYKVQFLGLDPAGFPVLEAVFIREGFLLDRGVLEQILRNSIFAVATDESRPALTGVNFDLSDEERVLMVVGADGFRLGMDILTIPEETQSASFILTQNSVKALQKILAKSQAGLVSLSYGQVSVKFEIDDMVLYCNLLNGQYPRVAEIIPTKFEREIVVNQAELERAIRSAAVFTREINVINFTIEGDVLLAEVTGSQIGPFRVELPVTVNGNNDLFVFGMNQRYLADIMGVIEGEFITIKANGTNDPFVIKGDGTALFVVMPMYVK